MAGWAPPYWLLRAEVRQRRTEGVEIPEDLDRRIRALDPERDAWATEAVEPLYDELMALPEDAALAAREPNDLVAIRALRPDGPRDLSWRPTRDEAVDRFHGAWTGRAAGCALGKPVEGVGMSVRDGRWCGRGDIRRHLEARGDWPLVDYFSGADADGDLQLICPASQREHIAYMEPDDDINYTLVALGVLEECGPDFDWTDVFRFWAGRIPYAAICTAETQAFLNAMNRSGRGLDPTGWWINAEPAWTRRHRNPYREWIGAQIRSDGWAYVAAGKPELAAELAHRDASWTHERNGIYGEMLFAAMQAAAFVEQDPRRLVEIGLSEIPGECRLAMAVRDLLTWIDDCPDFDACMARIERDHGTLHPTHTINNALVCIQALHFGGADPAAAITTAVMSGLDTDCNGATVGSVVGAGAGRARFRGPLVDRLNDTIRPSLIGFEVVTMADLAVRTWEQWQRVDAYAARRQ